MALPRARLPPSIIHPSIHHPSIIHPSIAIAKCLFKLLKKKEKKNANPMRRRLKQRQSTAKRPEMPQRRCHANVKLRCCVLLLLIRPREMLVVKRRSLPVYAFSVMSDTDEAVPPTAMRVCR